MDINHEKLAEELEDKFVNRFTDKDEDYVRSLKLRDVSPPLIYPYWNHQNNFRRRDNHYDNRNNYQQNDQQRNYNQQYNQYRSNETYSNYRQDKKRKYDD